LSGTSHVWSIHPADSFESTAEALFRRHSERVGATVQYCADAKYPGDSKRGGIIRPRGRSPAMGPDSALGRRPENRGADDQCTRRNDRRKTVVQAGPQKPTVPRGGRWFL